MLIPFTHVGSSQPAMINPRTITAIEPDPTDASACVLYSDATGKVKAFRINASMQAVQEYIEREYTRTFLRFSPKRRR